APTRGTIDLVNGSTGTLTIQSGLTIGGTSAGQFSTLNFEIGPSGSDNITSSSLLLNSGGAVINVTGLSGFGAGTYNLLTFTSSTFDGSFTLGTTPGGAFTYMLGFNGTTTEFLTVSAATTTYWKGDQDNTWNTNNGGTTNWYVDQSGTINTAIPGSSSDVIFATTDGTNLNTELGQDF